MTSTAERRFVAVYQTIRILPGHEQPLYIYRKDGKTIVAIDPRATRFDIVSHLVDPFIGLTELEANALRDAYKVPHRNVGQLPSEFVSDALCLLYTPPAVRLHDEPAIQGGEYLAQRIAAGDLPHEELLMLTDEPPSLARTRELAKWVCIKNDVLRIKQEERSQVG